MIVMLAKDRYRIADPRCCPPAMLQYLRALLAPTDFDRVEPLPDESPEWFLVRKIESVLPVAVPFLSVMLLPEGCTERDWSPAMAKRTARRLRALDGPAARESIEGLARVCVANLLEARAALLSAALPPDPTTVTMH